MGDIIETAFGTPVDPKLMALGSASRVERKGAFFVFSIRLDQNDVREYVGMKKSHFLSYR